MIIDTGMLVNGGGGGLEEWVPTQHGWKISVGVNHKEFGRGGRGGWEGKMPRSHHHNHPTGELDCRGCVEEEEERREEELLGRGGLVCFREGNVGKGPTERSTTIRDVRAWYW